MGERVTHETASSPAACVSFGDDGDSGFFGRFLACGLLTCSEEAPDADSPVPHDGDEAEEMLNQAELEERKGNYAYASDLYKKALRLDPANATAHNNYGYLCSTHTRDYASAEYHYREAIKRAPDYALAHNNLAYFLKRNKRDFDGAERHYREAIRCDPDYAFAHSNLGVLLKSKKDIQGAEFHYLAAIRSNPRYAPAFLNYALLLKSHNESACREYLDRAVSIDPTLCETPAARSLYRSFNLEPADVRDAPEPEHRIRLGKEESDDGDDLAAGVRTADATRAP